MAIKATTKDITSKAGYPKLMICKITNAVVLFSNTRCGTEVRNDYYKNNIGYYSDMWDMNDFEDFSGTVELTNDYSI